MVTDSSQERARDPALQLFPLSGVDRPGVLPSGLSPAWPHRLRPQATAWEAKLNHKTRYSERKAVRFAKWSRPTGAFCVPVTLRGNPIVTCIGQRIGVGKRPAHLQGDPLRA